VASVELSLAGLARPSVLLPVRRPDKLTFGAIQSIARAKALAQAPARAAPAGTYTVSLHFSEPGTAAKGERIFTVAIQGTVVLKDFDVAAEAGRALKPVVKTFNGVKVDDRLTVTLTPGASAKVPRPVLCGIEVRKER
jgi:hypothetical protein